MGKTLKELFKGSPLDKAVKEDKETFIEQETSGLRVRSAVELNNPLIYGNEAGRISLRSTPLLEEMKNGTGTNSDGGGLIGGEITKARNTINSELEKLGVPFAQIPTKVAKKIIELRAKDTTSQDPITLETMGANVTEIGKALKQSGGGNPKTIGKQALGSGISYGKDKLRGELFGEGQGVGTAKGKEYSVEYTTNKRTYLDVNKSKTLPSEEGVKKDLEKTKLDISLVSPLYGVSRKDGKFGKSEYAFQHRGDRDKDGNYSGEGQQAPLNRYDRDYTKSGGKYPISDKTSKLNQIGKLTGGDFDSFDDETGTYKKGQVEVAKDFIPFYIGRLDGNNIPFRALLTGITETVSPSWNTNKMLGNPFPFYTYSQIERNTSFNLKIASFNETELELNWDRIERLTKMTYPRVNQNNLVNPPIISFRLGDIYVNKIGFIENLTYTIPDNGVWETRDGSSYLPKFIEVSISIKFIEDTSVLTNLYGLKKSKAAVEKIKEQTKSNGFSESPKTGPTPSVEVGQGQFGEFGTDGNFGGTKIKVTKRGIVPISDTGFQVGSIPSSTPQSKTKSLEPKGIAKTSTPIEAETGKGEIPIQSSIVDKIEAETPIEAVKKESIRNNYTEAQMDTFMNMGAYNGKVEMVPINSLPEYAKLRVNRLVPGQVFVKTSTILDGRLSVIYDAILQDGTVRPLGADGETHKEPFGPQPISAYKYGSKSEYSKPTVPAFMEGFGGF